MGRSICWNRWSTPGRAFADVHHLLGVSLSLLGQAERALGELGRALELNPRYVEALIHQGLVLNELGRTDEAQDAFGRAAEHLANPTAASRRRWRRSWPTGTLSWLRPMPAPARSTEPSSSISPPSSWGPGSTTCATGWRGSSSRPAARWKPVKHWSRWSRARPNFVDAEAALGLAHYLSGDAAGARSVWQTCLARRPENARVEAYLAMLGAGGAVKPGVTPVGWSLLRRWSRYRR